MRELQVQFAITGPVVVRESTYTDAKVVAVVLADVLDEVDRVIEPALGRLPLFDTTRRVTAEC